MWALAALLLQTVAAQPGNPAAPDPAAPVVEVAMRGYGANGASSGSAGDSDPETATGYVWSDEALCTFGANSRELSFTPSVGWHYTARITRRTGDEFALYIEWERIGSTPRQVTVPRGGGGRFTLRMGDHLELDRLDAGTPGPCQTMSLRLEAAITTRSSLRGAVRLPGSTWSVGRAGAGGRGGGGAGSGRGMASAGVVERPVDPVMSPQRVPAAGPTVQSDDDVRLKAAALATLLQAQAARARTDASLAASLRELTQMLDRPRLDAEVWLVHRLPGGTEETQRLAARFASRASIAFAPVAVLTPRGALSVDVTTVLRISPGATGPPLSVAISRRIRAGGAPPVDNSGGSDRLLALPKPDEVTSFELPPLAGSMRDVLAGHTFSLRLRIGPEVVPAAIR